MSKRASYRAAVAWIAENDEPCEDDPSVIEWQLTVSLVADLFGKDPRKVAEAVQRCREGHS